jgi:uncharacterized protein (DUF2342 family)
MRPTIKLAVFAAALALAAAGCGGSSDKKANEAYANSVCTAIGTWQQDVRSIATDFSGGISKASLQKKLTQFETATKSLVSQVKAVPPPDTSQGQAAKKQVDTLATEVQTTTSAVKSTAAKIPPDATVAQTASALSTLAPQFQTLLSTAQSTVSSLQSAGGSLASAFQSASACKNLGG